ncbi:MAG TPA: hypothetical protein PK675_04120 [Clostridia bacterium]|nr:hypothetical protein [Clostridia bacterium]
MKMKNFLIGMALGVAAGMCLAEIPAVKNFITTGKKKIKKMVKANDD